jgi:hypothetical protein
MHKYKFFGKKVTKDLFVTKEMLTFAAEISKLHTK